MKTHFAICCIIHQSFILSKYTVLKMDKTAEENTAKWNTHR